ncbi:MAG TPA: hypothetical protein VHY37_03915 [Tepidisphaeraceae bacterium]|jgi:hypothetical protein|nr:hypothetical protein [Tepidisphaeraceae bacterium]
MSGHHTNDTLVDTDMLCRSVREICRRVHLDCEHDIPYLAGYNMDRSKIYDGELIKVMQRAMLK